MRRQCGALPREGGWPTDRFYFIVVGSIALFIVCPYANGGHGCLRVGVVAGQRPGRGGKAKGRGKRRRQRRLVFVYVFGGE